MKKIKILGVLGVILFFPMLFSAMKKTSPPHHNRKTEKEDFLKKINEQKQQARLILREKGSQSLKQALAEREAEIRTLKDKKEQEKRQQAARRGFSPQGQSRKKTCKPAQSYFFEARPSTSPIDPKLGHGGGNNYKEEQEQYEKFYAAYIRHKQEVVNGKSISFILRDPIPLLDLPKGIILRGVPKISGGRILIEISSCVIGNKLVPLRLLIFDKEDCQPGIFHDDLCKVLEEETEDTALDAFSDFIDIPGKKLIDRGLRIAKKKRTISLPTGKEILLRVPRLEVKKNRKKQ